MLALLNTGTAGSYDVTSQTPDWLKAIYEEPMPETEEYGIRVLFTNWPQWPR